jgi:hypothetical protein
MSEPKGTLDTSVNGPEDPPGEFDADAWQQVDWRMHEERVRRLRRRIFKAVQDGDLAKARNLQKLMLRSWSNTLISVRQVTQRNAGRATAGIDGRVALIARGPGAGGGAGGQVSPGTGPAGTGAGMGGPVRGPIVWVCAPRGAWHRVEVGDLHRRAVAAA